MSAIRKGEHQMKLKRFFKYSLQIGIAGLILNIFLFATNIFYEMVVPLLEKSDIEGAAFNFIDNLIYFTPCIFIGLFALYIIAGALYKRYYYPKIEDKVFGHMVRKNDRRQKELDERLIFLSRTYYRNCPKCGAPRDEKETVCSSCGASLTVR